MKKLITILLTTGLVFVAYAQEPTSTLCMPTKVAKKVVQELVAGDSAKALLKATETQLSLNEKVLTYKDSLLIVASSKEIIYTNQIRNEQAEKQNYINLYDNCKSQYNELAKKERRTRIKSKMKSIIGLPALIALGVLLILK